MKIRSLFVLVAAVCLSALFFAPAATRAQVSEEEAMAKLRAKTEARRAAATEAAAQAEATELATAREANATLRKDNAALKADVDRLKAEVASLKKRLADTQAAAITPPTTRPNMGTGSIFDGMDDEINPKKRK